MLDEKKLHALIVSVMSEFLDSFKRKVYYACEYRPAIDTYLCVLSDKPIQYITQRFNLYYFSDDTYTGSFTKHSEQEEKFIIRGFDFATIHKDKYEDMIFGKLEIAFTNLGKKFSQSEVQDATL